MKTQRYSNTESFKMKNKTFRIKKMRKMIQNIFITYIKIGAIEKWQIKMKIENCAYVAVHPLSFFAFHSVLHKINFHILVFIFIMYP